MAEVTPTKLNPESHLLLDQPLLRLPAELSRKNFKLAALHVEHDRKALLAALKTTANDSLSGRTSASESLDSLDAMINRMRNLKRKMNGFHEEERTIRRQTRARLEHLHHLYRIPSLADVKYDDWSRLRLNRLLVDYLLRSGYGESAAALAKEKGIEDLVDLDIFMQCHKVEESLRGKSTQECLAWCSEHRELTRKTHNTLEFELRLQQYIELRRRGQLTEARQHAHKYITSDSETNNPEIHRAAGLLAYAPETKVEPYKTMYSSSRWDFLSNLFVKTHHELFSLPSRPLMHIALSAGLSALKTPSCHSMYASSSSNASSTTTTVCPICSTELNELARNLRHVQHNKSSVEHDPIVLPNGRVYGRERLLEMSSKVGLEEGKVKDPTTSEVFDASQIRKVFIS
ncbi:MAG: hypothetical protein LQ348_000263 [Seirophora lacunosa]|nr:MAG: hypothetical protein LQ344_001508 [Seirophora lacunosa]KAI4208200.1 MAG: hypothetical protein LQ348_000263 [Seirophora lacunosa]